MAPTTKYYLKTLFDLEVKDQGPTKVITVRDTPSYGHAPTYQISLTYLERQKNIMARTRKYYLKQLFYLEVKGQGPRKVITIYDTPPYGHASILNIMDLSQKKQLFDLEVKEKGPTKVITVRDAPPDGHTTTYQISLTYLKTKMLWP